jgi:DNA replication protein DnaC
VNPTLPDLPPSIRPLLTPESQHLRRTYPNIPSSPKDCITCGGRKTFLWYATGRTDPVVTYDCRCNDQFVLHRVLLASGVKEAYQNLGWADFTHATDSAFEMLAEWQQYEDRYLKAGIGLIISGTRGTGKSLMAHLMIKDLIAAGKTCHVTTFAGMIDLFAAGWYSPEDKAWFNGKVRNADVLLIDDLGREHNKSETSIGSSMIEAVVRDRVNRGLPTFVTTNLSRDEVAQGYGPHTMSLLSEKSEFVTMNGVDQREVMKARTLSEIHRGIQRPIMISEVNPSV